jgi:hypothetical protein
MPDRLNQVVANEPSGGTWHKVADPAVGWLSSKTSGWTADRFTSATGGFEVDFSGVVPVGTKAVRAVMYAWCDVDGHYVYARKEGDANISNTPNASTEYSHIIDLQYSVQYKARQVVLWLSINRKAEIAVTHVNYDIYVSHPLEYMI